MPRPTLFDHPKFLRLAHILKLPRPYALGLLEYLWRIGYASGNPVIGDEIDVELACEWTGDQGALANALLTTGFLDRLDSGKLQIHDLEDHAPKYVKQRKYQEDYRRRQKNSTVSSLLANSEAPPSPAPSPAPIKNPNPLPPSLENGQHSDPLADIAQRVVDYYQTTIKPEQTKARGVKNVTTILRKGITEAQLKTCADGYLDSCIRANKAPRYRYAVGNFYGRDELYKEHLNYTPKKRREDMTPEECEESDRKWREEVKARKFAPDTGGQP